jgi:hypothetical protein
MLRGEVLGERFEIEMLAGSGGMGEVYAARDRSGGERVAVKVLAAGDVHAERFAEESRVLARMTHPAVVRYVAHGITREGAPYLVMEWLDGEDLAARLVRAPLNVAESITLAKRVAAALAAAHGRGVVHRDVKPSNVFLVDGDPAQAKLLDFGIARRATRTAALTRSNTVLGTVGYMAPEQAFAEGALDARVDVFSLGCVLFECLARRPAFQGQHVVAILAKILREDAERLRTVRPGLPAELDDLVARMLSKDPSVRPVDGGAVAAELEALGRVAEGETLAPPAPGPSVQSRLTAGELRLVTVILGRPDRASLAVAETASMDEVVSHRADLETLVARFGGEIDELWDGTLLVTSTAGGSARDRAAQAASCALAFADILPGAVVLATGRADVRDPRAVGSVIDRAAGLLQRRGRSGVQIDDLTAGLLDERHEVTGEPGGLTLRARRADGQGARTLLGKRTPTVGREKELALLEAAFAECSSEPMARAAVVTGPPGIGKSRLRHELVARVRGGGDASVLIARADPVTAGSPLALLRQLIRNAAATREAAPADEQRAAIREHLEPLLEEPDRRRYAEFLGELLGVGAPPAAVVDGSPAGDPPSPQLVTARNDPRVMAEWLRRSFAAWIAALCRVRPVLVVLEDLHWGDIASITYLSGALSAAAGSPLMVLALARPEVHDVFPRLFEGAAEQRLQLAGLTRRAAERLIRAALGDAIDADVAASIVARAEGNAYYLEELIRQVAEQRAEGLPDTLLAMAEARIARLDPEARRILRAASIFGGVFWSGGLAALLGGDLATRDLGAWLDALVEDEVLVRAVRDRFADQREYAFRHGLSREAAYAMLTDADRATGHRLAGAWLEEVGERDARALADHFERGGELERAARWFQAAAHAAVVGSDGEGAIALAERGLACGASGALRGALFLQASRGHAYLGDMVACLGRARSALELLPPGSADWLQATANLVVASLHVGDPAGIVEVLQATSALQTEPEPTGAHGFVGFSLVMSLLNVGASRFSIGCSGWRRGPPRRSIPRSMGTSRSRT